MYLGNMDALRDWGHAKDYVRMQWMMLQQEQAEDFVIATGKQISVREFVRMSCKEAGIEVGDVIVEFNGIGIDLSSDLPHISLLDALLDPRKLLPFS